MQCGQCGAELDGLKPVVDLFAADGSPRSQPLAFCPRCGWPLARARVAIFPRDELALTGAEPGELRVRLTNEGDGALYYSLDLGDGLRPASAPQLHGHVPARAEREVIVLAPPEVADRERQARVTVHTLSAEPEVLGQPRLGAVEELWRAHEFQVPLSRLTAGPLELDTGHLLFGPGDERFVQVANHGGLPLDAEVRCSRGFLLCGEVDTGFTSGARLRLRPGRPQTERPRAGITPLRVRADETADELTGELTLRVAGLPPRTVALERVVPQPPPLPEFRYTVGLDFGTSKTAVAIVDNLALPPTPRGLEWPRRDPTADPRWLPSAVFYDATYGQASFGDDALARSGANVTEVGVRLDGAGRYRARTGTLFVGMKMFLRDESADESEPSMQTVAVDFFRYLFETLETRGGVRLAEAQVVLSLPVLSDAAAAQQQEERTRAAALAAGRLFGLAPGQVQCEKEPVCAAIDLVRLQAEGRAGAGDGLTHGDWLCVFDAGAGTTDISLLEVIQQGGEWRFARLEPLGYEWGGDDLDQLLYDYLLGLWGNPDDPANIPASGPVTIKPVRLPGRTDQPVIDVDRPTRQPAAIDWFAYLRSQREFLFNGASQPVSRAELLGLVSRFKERFLHSRTPADERATTETPLLPLSPTRRGDRGPWAPLARTEMVRRVSLEFLEMSDGREKPLRVRFPELCRDLEILRPRWIAPVGGATLVAGWEEAVRDQPLGLDKLLAADPELRRLHVARGAAQKPLFRVQDRLPAPAVLQLCRWRPGQEPELLDEQSLAAGAPPGERQEIGLVGSLALQPGQWLLLRVWLGERLLKQMPVAWYEGRETLAGLGLPTTSTIRLSATLAYARRPAGLLLRARWLTPGEPEVWPAVTIALPRFEE